MLVRPRRLGGGLDLKTVNTQLVVLAWLGSDVRNDRWSSGEAWVYIGGWHIQYGLQRVPRVMLSHGGIFVGGKSHISIQAARLSFGNHR